MNSIKNEIINKEDYEIIIDMAKKYNMSVEDFGRLLSKKIDRNIRHQIRFNVDEIQIIDNRAGELNMTRSEYCRRCYMKAIKDKVYMNMDIKSLKENTYGKNVVRDIKVCLYFNDADAYLEMRKIAKEYALQFSTLLRHFSLAVEL